MCGIFGIFGQDDAAAYTALGLHALQHRGQESGGIVTFDGENFHQHRDLGLVGDIFGSEEIISQLPGYMAVGHVRYSTSGDTILRNVQPLFANYANGGMAVVHNGTLTNADEIRQNLTKRGSIFQSTTDTEVIIHLISTSLKEDLIDRLIDTLDQIAGAYSIVIMTNRRIIGVRDPHGVRPLSIGRLDDAYFLSSESTAFDINGAELVRDVEPGEIVWIDKYGIHSRHFGGTKPRKLCIFEYVYFARPDSIIDGKTVSEIRKQIGVELAREAPVYADVVVPIPDSGVPGAIGFASESGIPFDMAIIRNHYVGRTFIQPTQKIRNLGVKLKHLTCRASLDGRRVVLVDDSIVRGTTAKKIVDMVKRAGASEVHFRVACPPTTDPCFYGIDTPVKKELIASDHTLEEIKAAIGVDSLEYLTINGLYRAVTGMDRDSEPKHCDACFTGEYPIKVPEEKSNIFDIALLRDLRDRVKKR